MWIHRSHFHATATLLVLTILTASLACGDTEGSASPEEGGGSGDPAGGGSTAPGGDPIIGLGSCKRYRTDEWFADVFVPEGASSDVGCSPEPRPCDSQPTGTWRLATACGYDLSPPSIDPSSCATLEAATPARSGSLVFPGDGTFSLEIGTEIAYSVVGHIDCLGLFDCAGSPVGPDSSYTGVGSGTSEACTCDVMGQRDAVQVRGELSSPRALVGPPRGVLPYCASDDRLEVWRMPAAEVQANEPCDRDGDCTPVDGTVAVCLAL